MNFCLACGMVCGVIPEQKPEPKKTSRKRTPVPFIQRFCKYCGIELKKRKGESQRLYNQKKSCGNRTCMRKWRKESGTDWADNKYY